MLGINENNFKVSEDIADREGQTIRVQECSHVSEDGPHVEIFISNISDVLEDAHSQKFIGLDFTVTTAKQFAKDLQEVIKYLEKQE